MSDEPGPRRERSAREALSSAVVHHPETTSSAPVPLALGAEERITRGDLPGLDLIHDRFARAVRNHLSRELGIDCAVEPRPILTQPYHQFSKALPFPCNLHLFRLRPFAGQCVLTLSETLSASVVETMFGGKVSSAAKRAHGARQHGNSAIETRLLTKFGAKLLDLFADAWRPVAPVEAIYGSIEHTPLAVTTLLPSDQVVTLRAGVTCADTAGELAVVMPRSALSGVRHLLTAGNAPTEAPLACAGPMPDTRIADALLRTTVEVVVRLGTGSLKLRDLIPLTTGDVIMLDTPATREADVLVGGQVKLSGTVGSRGGRKAVAVTRASSAE